MQMMQECTVNEVSSSFAVVVVVLLAVILETLIRSLAFLRWILHFSMV